MTQLDRRCPGQCPDRARRPRRVSRPGLTVTPAAHRATQTPSHGRNRCHVQHSRGHWQRRPGIMISGSRYYRLSRSRTRTRSLPLESRLTQTPRPPASDSAAPGLGLELSMPRRTPGAGPPGPVAQWAASPGHWQAKLQCRQLGGAKSALPAGSPDVSSSC